MPIILMLAFSVFSFASSPDFKAQLSAKKIIATGSTAKAIMFVGYLNGCPLFAKYQSRLQDLKQKFGDQLVVVNFDPSVNGDKNSQKNILALKKMGNEFPLVHDPKGELNSKLGISIASEVAVVRLSDNELVYRGAIDDRLTLDFERPKAQHNYAMDAIELAVSGQTGALPFTTASGCSLNTKTTRQ